MFPTEMYSQITENIQLFFWPLRLTFQRIAHKMCTCSVNEALKLKHACSISNCILWAHARVYVCIIA